MEKQRGARVASGWDERETNDYLACTYQLSNRCYPSVHFVAVIRTVIESVREVIKLLTSLRVVQSVRAVEA